MFTHKNTIRALGTRISEGDSAALAELYQICYSDLLRFGVHLYGANQTFLVEEQIQELFLWIAQNFKQLNRVQKLEIYLFQALRQRLIQANANIAKRKVVKTRYHLRTRNTFIDSTEETLFEEEKREVQAQMLTAAIQNLPPQQRTILHLRFFQGFDYEEIAGILSTNQQVCRNYVHRAIKKLRKQLNLLNSNILF